MAVSRVGRRPPSILPLSRNDQLHEACGVFGVFAPGEDVARLTFFSLFALQHRGQESSGIATQNDKGLSCYSAMGLVSQVFNEEALGKLQGHMAIGHNRYSTTGSSKACNAQPVVVTGPDGKIALGHNGNVVNAEYLRSEMADLGVKFATTTDSEVIANLVALSPGQDWTQKIKAAMQRLQGAYSIVMLAGDSLYGFRDPFGVRPLCMGRINGGWVIASETCALDHTGACFDREVEPGEIVRIDSRGVASVKAVESSRKALCIFEYIYFARPDSTINGRLVYSAREEMGRMLAREHPVDADLVVGVPDSATVAGMGYSHESGLPFTSGLLKNRYVHRTFIEPDQRIRDLGVKLKFNPLPGVLGGKRVVVVDDSIVRGTTTPRVIAMLRKAGVKEVHLRICAPPIRYPCFFGVDMATRKELVAAQKTIPEIRDFVGADSLGYLSLDGLVRSVALPKDCFCLACFTGDYPVPVQLEMDKLALEMAPAAKPSLEYELSK